MKKVECEERDRMVRELGLVPFAGSTNFMGNGLVTTTWGDPETEEILLEEETRYEPGGWPDPKKVTSCEHRAYARGERLEL